MSRDPCSSDSCSPLSQVIGRASWASTPWRSNSHLYHLEPLISKEHTSESVSSLALSKSEVASNPLALSGVTSTKHCLTKTMYSGSQPIVQKEVWAKKGRVRLKKQKRKSEGFPQSIWDSSKKAEWPVVTVVKRLNLWSGDGGPTDSMVRVPMSISPSTWQRSKKAEQTSHQTGTKFGC